ncbi:error-prone DNA polymerase [Microbulbifer aggregans]|uniref:Error-prone DNA polymerase n=1 Tax=Microbulbifer aggregans TaxID=1769779 RepID=A0A1C9WBL0_9GAMM|nr:PHP domain-containing protein [Microbulbifer aggregans]AOS98538.1 error-prone DNA polymerase [Microbulbifer aggregans]
MPAVEARQQPGFSCLLVPVSVANAADGCGRSYDSFFARWFNADVRSAAEKREADVKALPPTALTGLVDLHCHSTASDGILSPAQLVSRAKSRGVTLLSLTDHDTVAGIPEARAAAAEQGISLVPGIEFSSRWGKQLVHLVGLDVNPESSRLQQAIQQRDLLRAERAERIAERLEKRGFAGALEGARRLAGDGVLGRPHFARWLVEAGHVEDAARAFKRYLGAGKCGDVTVEWPQLEETVAEIHGAGGYAVLAHPLKYGMTRTRLLRLMTAFRAAGGDGVELLCGRQNPVQTREVVRLMAEASAEAGVPGALLSSVGSDFHQPDQPWRELGCVQLPADVEPVWNLWQTSANETAATPD